MTDQTLGMLKEEVRRAEGRLDAVVEANAKVALLLENDRAHAVRQLRMVNRKVEETTYKSRKDQENAVFELDRAKAKYEEALKKETIKGGKENG